MELSASCCPTGASRAPTATAVPARYAPPAAGGAGWGQPCGGHLKSNALRSPHWPEGSGVWRGAANGDAPRAFSNFIVLYFGLLPPRRRPLRLKESVRRAAPGRAGGPRGGSTGAGCAGPRPAGAAPAAPGASGASGACSGSAEGYERAEAALARAVRAGGRRGERRRRRQEGAGTATGRGEVRGSGGLLALEINFKTTRGCCLGKRSAGEDAESGLGSLPGAGLTLLVAWGCWGLILYAGYKCFCRACCKISAIWRCTVHRQTQGFAGGGALSVLSHAVCVLSDPAPLLPGLTPSFLPLLTGQGARNVVVWPGLYLTQHSGPWSCGNNGCFGLLLGEDDGAGLLPSLCCQLPESPGSWSQSLLRPSLQRDFCETTVGVRAGTDRELQINSYSRSHGFSRFTSKAALLESQV